MEAAEDVYRYQEIDSEDEKGGVTLDSGYRDVSNRGQFNPDELYFNDMDLRAWERRTAGADGVMYGDDSFEEDEGYYDETGSVSASTIEYEEQMFQAVLSKIRQARSTGGSGVQLTPEELEIYQSRVMRPRVPAAHSPQEQPQSSRSRPPTVPVQTTLDSIINMSSNAVSAAPVAGSTTGSTRSSKEKRRSSIFGSRPKKEKDKSNSSRKRSDSNATESVYHPPPGFVVPGQDGQQTFAPINSHPPRRPREPTTNSSVPTRPHSRSTSMYSRQATVSTRTTPPRDIPGAFPGSPQRYTREYTAPVQQPRPPSSHSSSVSDYIEKQSPPVPRSRPSSMQEPVKLVPFPVAPYQHHSAEPYQYHVPGQPAPSPYPPPIPQPQYTRQLSGHSESSHTAMPRRVPVPSSQQSASPTSAPQGLHPSPVLGNHAPVAATEPVRDEGYGVVTVDVVPQPDPTGYNVHAVKASGKDGERKRKVKTKKKAN